MNTVTVKSSQKLFTDDEISRLTGICLDHLHKFARSKHLGTIVKAAESAGEQAERWLFTNSELMILAVLIPRCHH
jgi:phage gp46-like protein